LLLLYHIIYCFPYQYLFIASPALILLFRLGFPALRNNASNALVALVRSPLSQSCQACSVVYPLCIKMLLSQSFNLSMSFSDVLRAFCLSFSVALSQGVLSILFFSLNNSETY
jgi:hypothetical protein